MRVVIAMILNAVAYNVGVMFTLVGVSLGTALMILTSNLAALYVLYRSFRTITWISY